MVLVYSQFHSPLVQYLTRAGMPQVAEWVALLVATNTLTAVLLLSIGETILFPLLNVLIDQMAPTHLKGSYFSARAQAGLGGAAGARHHGRLRSCAPALGRRPQVVCRRPAWVP